MAGVHVQDDGHLRILRLSNPTRRNALDRAMLAQLTGALPAEPAGARQPVRCVVLAGDPDGGAFSSGYDIRRIDDEERAAGLDPIEAPADAIARCPVPVVAAIDGACMGGAFELAMACTLRVASSAARFSMPPARLGLVYSVRGLQRFLAALPPGQVQRLFLSASTIDGSEAARVGIVDVLAEAGPDGAGAEAEARRIANGIARNAPLAVAGMLDAIRRLARGTPADADDARAIEAARARAIASADLAEGVQAFMQKREPAFRGE